MLLAHTLRVYSTNVNTEVTQLVSEWSGYLWYTCRICEGVDLSHVNCVEQNQHANPREVCGGQEILESHVL